MNMSDSSEDTISERQGDKEDNICRDFIRGFCERRFCKYKHDSESKMTLNFCHDFQNTMCPRLNCKFIHCSPDEELEYKKSGIMSGHILAEATRKSQLPGTPPICNQFRKGLCRRSFCKYRHVTKEGEEAEILELLQDNVKRQLACMSNNQIVEVQPVAPTNGLNRRCNITYDEYEECGIQMAKRRLLAAHPEQEIIANNELQHSMDPNHLRPVFKGYFAANPPPAMLSRVDARTLLLEEENSILHKEIAQLKRQVSDLTATNEFLLDQNANLRVSNKRNDGVNLPAVTITNTNTPQMIRTVTASVATVPVSLATVSTCNPVSVSIAGCPAVSMASPAQLLAPSQQILVTTNPTTQLALANSSQAQLAIAQQNLAKAMVQQAQAQPQLPPQAQQLTLATTTQQLALASNQQLTSQPQQLTLANTQQTHQQQLNQQLTSQAQQLANQQLTSQAQQLANQQLTSQAQQLANQQLTSQAQQLANQQLTSQAQQLANQQLTSQAQQLALANTTQQLTSQAQQLALANTTQQLTSQAQQLAMANTPQHLTVANMPQQLALASTNQQLLASNQQIEIHRSTQINGINTSQALGIANTSQPMVSFPLMTQNISHALTH